MDRARDIASGESRRLLAKLVEMGEQQFNIFVRKLSGLFALAGLLYGLSIVALKLFGVLNLPLWQEVSLLILPPLLVSVSGHCLVTRVRKERVKYRKDKKRTGSAESQDTFGKPTNSGDCKEYRERNGNR